MSQHKTLVSKIVDRFLSWKLPKGFNPDGGITFTPTKPYEGDERGNSRWPVGTNLFSADQAKDMVTHILAGNIVVPTNARHIAVIRVTAEGEYSLELNWFVDSPEALLEHIALLGGEGEYKLYATQQGEIINAAD